MQRQINNNNKCNETQLVKFSLFFLYEKYIFNVEFEVKYIGKQLFISD